MKTTPIIAVFFISTFSVNAQIKVNAGKKLNQVKKQVESKVASANTIQSTPDMVEGLKEALVVGANKSIGVDQCIESINRSAEDAVSTSGEIFLKTIKEMSVEDAVGIIKGGDHAATNYLKFETMDSIKSRMMPIIEASLKKTDATKFWKDVFTNYNRLTRNKVNPDLKSYVAEKAIDGLFLLIAREEELIRKDPLARTTDLLKRTFGGNK